MGCERSNFNCRCGIEAGRGRRRIVRLDRRVDVDRVIVRMMLTGNRDAVARYVIEAHVLWWADPATESVAVLRVFDGDAENGGADVCGRVAADVHRISSSVVSRKLGPGVKVTERWRGKPEIIFVRLLLLLKMLIASVVILVIVQLIVCLKEWNIKKWI